VQQDDGGPAWNPSVEITHTEHAGIDLLQWGGKNARARYWRDLRVCAATEAEPRGGDGSGCGAEKPAAARVDGVVLHVRIPSFGCGGYDAGISMDPAVIYQFGNFILDTARTIPYGRA
jgi:hypothetical protein